jgi:hypothetical protein
MGPERCFGRKVLEDRGFGVISRVPGDPSGHMYLVGRVGVKTKIEQETTEETEAIELAPDHRDSGEQTEKQKEKENQ